MSQLDLFANTNFSHTPPEIKVELDHGEYIYIPGFFNPHESDHFFNSLRQKVDWKQESMSMYGRKVAFPRLIAWYGEDNKPYSFSGITLYPSKWLPELLEIKRKIEPVAKVAFNRVLLNLYRDGRDSVSWHTDAEPELGRNPVIASVSLGATRKFQLRHLHTKEKIELELTSGSLLIMQGELQHYWQHQIPKTSKTVGERINLTFRLMH
jgi:alkylated DNA repair dioxygenase AlkB